MKLDDLKENWERLAAEEGLHSILYRSEEHGGEYAEDEYLRAGEVEIDHVMTTLRSLGHDPGRQRALDFGCAAGRLTQGLKRHFDEAVGVDISSAMLEHARRYNRHGDACRFVLNAKPDLRVFADAEFDMVYSNITLQHNETQYIEGYIREFHRIVRPGGALVFQVPSRNLASLRHRIRIQAPYPLKKLYRSIKTRLTGQRFPIEMPIYTMPRARVERLLTEMGSTLLHAEENRCAGDEYESFWYYVRR